MLHVAADVRQLGQQAREGAHRVAVEGPLNAQQDPGGADLDASVEPGAVALLEALPASLEKAGRPAFAVRPALVLHVD